MRRWKPLAGLVLLVLSVGCDTGLVTGYQPRRLGDSPAARRAYYAGKFTPEAQAAEQERTEDVSNRRPTPSSPGGPSPY